jgi:hypothetical protein
MPNKKTNVVQYSCPLDPGFHFSETESSDMQEDREKDDLKPSISINTWIISLKFFLFNPLNFAHLKMS